MEISEDELEANPKQAMINALHGKVALTKGQFLFARSAMLNLSPETVARRIEVDAELYQAWEQADNPMIPDDKLYRLKSVLQCRDNQYDALFDSIMTPEKAKPLKPTTSDTPSADHSSQTSDPATPAAQHSILVRPSGGPWEERVPKPGDRLPTLLPANDVMAQIHPFPARRATRSLWVQSQKPWHYNASDYPDVEAEDYCPMSGAMTTALSRQDFQRWNLLLQSEIAGKPDLLIDMRGINLRAMELNLTQFNFSQCDMRGVNWPKSVHCTHMVLNQTQLVNGLHDSSNSDYKSLYSTVRQCYESASSKNLTTQQRRDR